MKLLQIYAQSNEHGDAWIIGDAEGLTALRDAINTALSEGSAVTTCGTSDEEGFMTFVAKSDLNTVREEDVLLPYTNAVYHKGKHPLVLVGPARYRDLAKVAIELDP